MVSILLIIDNYYINRFCIETMLKYCAETEVEILAVNNSNTKEFDDFFTAVLTSDAGDKQKRVLFPNLVGYGEIDEFTSNKARAFNKLIKEAKGDYICIFDSYSIVSNGWLYDLLSYHKTFPKVGAVAIPDFETKKTYTGLLDKKDEIVNVWKPAGGSFSVNGIALFSKEILNEGNCFDESSENDSFIKEFTGKIGKHGWENFYVPGHIHVNSSVGGRSINRKGETI